MDTGRREFYISVWDYVIHITEVLFLIQVKILEYVDKKICTQFGLEIKLEEPYECQSSVIPKDHHSP
jgi:hypothetical protein